MPLHPRAPPSRSHSRPLRTAVEPAASQGAGWRTNTHLGAHPVSGFFSAGASGISSGLVGGLLGLLALTLLWDWSGADMWVMRGIGSPAGFALRDHWLLTRVLHDGLRQLALLLLLGVCGWAGWALWPRRLAPEVNFRERLVVLLLIGLSLLAVNLLKYNSLSSCPWSLQAFGGSARYLSHWQVGLGDGGPGRCFPGGHAASGFGFFALCLPWLQPPQARPRRRAVGSGLLLAVLVLGLLAGVTQTLRGAHHPSHTLWTLAVCAGVSLLGWRGLRPWFSGPRA